MLNYDPARPGQGTTEDGTKELPVIEIPTLMVWGLEDTALSKETTNGTDQYVTDLTLRFLPDVSHWVQQEAPETVNAMPLPGWRMSRFPKRLTSCSNGSKTWR